MIRKKPVNGKARKHPHQRAKKMAAGALAGCLCAQGVLLFPHSRVYIANE